MLNLEALGRYVRYRTRFRLYAAACSLATAAYLRVPKRHSEAHEHRNALAHELDLAQRNFRRNAMQNWHWSETAKKEVIDGVQRDR